MWHNNHIVWIHFQTHEVAFQWKLRDQRFCHNTRVTDRQKTHCIATVDWKWLVFWCRRANIALIDTVRLLWGVLSCYVYSVDSSQSALLSHPSRHTVFSAVVSRCLYLRPSTKQNWTTSHRLDCFHFLCRVIFAVNNRNVSSARLTWVRGWVYCNLFL